MALWHKLTMPMRWGLISLAAFFFFSTSNLLEASQRVKSDVMSLLQLHKEEQALELLWLHKEDKELEKLLIKTLAKTGRIEEAVRLFLKSYTVEDDDSLRLLEEVAWSYIWQAQKSGNILVRARALIAAAMAQDPRTAALIEKVIEEEPHPLLRCIAFKASAELHCFALFAKIAELLPKEKNRTVRMAMIEALAKSGHKDYIASLEKIYFSPNHSSSERHKAAAAIAELCQFDRYELIKRCLSSQDGLARQLGCELAAQTVCKEALDQLWVLAEDSLAGVRVMALQTIALLQGKEKLAEEKKKKVRLYLLDLQPSVRLTAAWLLTFLADEESRDEGVKRLLEGAGKKAKHERELAVAMIAHCGAISKAELSRLLSDSGHSASSRLNAAVALVRRDAKSKEAANYIASVVKNKGAGLSCKSTGIFEYYEAAADGGGCVNSEEDAMVRLELLKLLSIAGHEEALPQLLEVMSKPAHFGVNGSAALLLLGERLEGANEQVKRLLEETASNSQKLQMALALALLNEGEKAASVLIELYPKVSREDKERILAFLAEAADNRQIAFLLEVMANSPPTLRLLAGCVLLQLLYK